MSVISLSLMRCIADIQDLAWSKFNDAEALLKAERYDGAFYIAGYTVELLLKAMICKAIKIEDFFHFGDSAKKYLSKEAYRPFKVHDFTQLMVLSGIYPDFDREFEQNDEFQQHWLTIDVWSEDARYVIGKSKADVKTFLESIKLVSKWIEEHLRII